MKNLKISKSLLSTLGLIMITCWSAVQYLFYSSIPDDISSFAFVFITNLCGCLSLSLFQFPHLKRITKTTVKKGALLGLILVFFNVFMLLGSRNMDSVISSGIVSLYFIFVTPLMLLLKKRVSFRSGVATVVAFIALLLVFNANIENLFSSVYVIFLIVADIAFACYVVAVSFMTEGEDPQAISVVQMACVSVLSLIAWIIETGILGHGTMELSSDPSFWVSVVFIGIFIRALYSVIQFAAQKNVHPVNASLIFASEVVITLILDPVLSRLLGTQYEKASVFQIVGCVLFVVAVLICDDGFMKKFHYNDMDTIEVTDESGNRFQQIPLSRKIVNMNLLIGLGALLFSTIVCLFSITVIRNNVITASREFGSNASSTSENALLEQVETELEQKVGDKAAVATEILDSYRSSVQYASKLAGQFLSDPEGYVSKPSLFPHIKNGGVWTMQLTLADESITEDGVAAQNGALGNMEPLFAAIRQNCPELTTIYMGTVDGLLVSYDPNSDSTECLGTPFYYDYRDSGWYTGAREIEGAGFTDTYMDGMGRGLTITCYAPIRSDGGQFLGAIGMDFLQTDLNRQLVDVGIVSPEKAVLVSADGIVIAATGNESSGGNAYRITDPESASTLPLLPVASQIIGESKGLLISETETGNYYVSFDKVESTGWKLCIISPVEDIIAPAVNIRSNIDSSTEQISATVSNGVRTIVASCLIFFAVIVLLVTYLVGTVSNRLTEPLSRLEKDVLEISRGNLDRRTDVSTHDEIGSLARAFNTMTSSLQQYITDITEMTAQEERIASELSVATRIQSSMLPDAAGAFPESSEFRVFATMDPAKDVGGDFYDFFMVDSRHLAIVMADVSGKSVPAALFMVIGKTLLKDHTQPGRELGDVFTEVNNLLCESNSEGLFITAFEGVLDLDTGEFRYVNAGHEMPFIMKAGGNFEAYKMRAGFVLAGMENMKYRSGEFILQPGDRIFQYTDGVTEATNAAEELYGMERLSLVLNSNKTLPPADLLHRIKEDIDSFAGEAPQFDDITMLCLDYFGPQGAGSK